MPVINPFPQYVASTFTPTVTLVGGAGNTVPVYTTNSGSYVRVGNRVFVDVYLTGDGGNEGAGTGQMNIALPFTAAASQYSGYSFAGTGINNTTYHIVVGEVAASATTIALGRLSSGAFNNFTGAEQSSTTRTIRLSFNYMAV